MGGGVFLGVPGFVEEMYWMSGPEVFLNVLMISAKCSRLELVIIPYERDFCDVFQGANFRLQHCVASDRVFYLFSVSNLHIRVLHSLLRQQLAEDICIAGFE